MAPDEAGAAGGVINSAHHLGVAVGIGILTSVFATAGSTTDGEVPPAPPGKRSPNIPQPISPK